MAARRRASRDALGGRGDGARQREDLLGRRDVVGGAGQEVHGAVDAAEVDRLVADAQRSADELVVAEEVLDEPQVEGPGDVLGVLEPVLEGAVALDMAGIADVGQQLQLLADLVLGLDGDEAADQELALQHAVAVGDQRAEEGQVVVAERLHALVDDGVAGVEVDRRAGDGERVDALGVQRRVDGGQPAALAVAHEVDVAAAAGLLHGGVDLGQVVGDRRVLGLLRDADPVQRVEALEAGGEDRLHLALPGAVVDDAGVVARLRRQDERGHDVGRARGREVAQARERAAAHDALARGPLRRAPVGHQLPPAQAVERHVSGRPALGDGRAPVVGHPADRGAPRLDRGVDRAARDRRDAAHRGDGKTSRPVHGYECTHGIGR